MSKVKITKNKASAGIRIVGSGLGKVRVIKEIPDLMLHIRLNKRDFVPPSTLKDRSPSNNNGIIKGGQFVPDKNNVNDGAMEFLENDYIDCGTGLNNIYQNRQISIAFWIKLNEERNTCSIISNRNINTKGNFFVFLLSSENNLGFDLYSSSNMVRWQTGYLVPINQWVHIAFTFDGTTTTLYVNGEYKETTIQKDIIFPNVTKKLLIAGDDGGYDYTLNGSMSDVRLYNRGLNAEEIKRIYRR